MRQLNQPTSQATFMRWLKTSQNQHVQNNAANVVWLNTVIAYINHFVNALTSDLSRHRVSRTLNQELSRLQQNLILNTIVAHISQLIIEQVSVDLPNITNNNIDLTVLQNYVICSHDTKLKKVLFYACQAEKHSQND